MSLFSEVLHIRPWELDLLTAEQFTTLREYLDRNYVNAPTQPQQQ